MEIAALYILGISIVALTDLLFAAVGGQEEVTTKRTLPEFCSETPDFALLKDWSPATKNTLQDQKMISVNYILWVGKCPLHSISLSIPENSTFLEIMIEAAKYDDKFHFCSDVYSFGHYVTTISSLKEQKEGKWHWLYYRIRQEPQLGSEFSADDLPKIGVQGFIPEHGDFLIFSYNKLSDYGTV